MLSKAFSWLSQGFELFKQAGFIFVFQTLFIFLTIVVSYLMKIFVLSVFLYVIQLLLTAGVFISFDNVKKSKKITFDNLFDGFSNNLSNLITLSIIFLLCSLVVSYFLVQFVNINDVATSFKHIDSKNYAPISFIMLVDIVVNFVLMLAIPFVAIQKLNVFKAIKESIIVCVKNLIPLIFLLIIYFVLAILATFSIIGWLVLFPVLIGSIYTIFKENYSM
ncbi:putative transmembrane protein [Desulfurella amilsii]|uniref:Putative transmembrane protein n=1 Tax=Desulfurella amilsii TaxID=1562698 RepID=A0A1X4XWG2_9BACT|nr:hypothetical protein [Desulfurella amilsii]OSS41871.1 putative transmembrane protein [Desulfurella amilsii]